MRNAYYGEAQTFDKCLGHQPGNGQYHHHAQPVCLRAQLGDNLVTVNTRRTGTIYREQGAPWPHSPILGWSFAGNNSAKMVSGGGDVFCLNPVSF